MSDNANNETNINNEYIINTRPNAPSVEKQLKRLHADKQTKNKRVSIIYKQILKGMTNQQILDKYTSEWNVLERQVYLYMHIAQKRIDEISLKKREDLFNEHLALRRELRNEAIDEGDKRLAFDILRDEAKLFDLYPDEALVVKKPEDIKVKYINDWRVGGDKENDNKSLNAKNDENNENIIEGVVTEIVEEND